MSSNVDPAKVEQAMVQFLMQGGMNGVTQQQLKEKFQSVASAARKAMNKLLFGNGPVKVQQFTRQGQQCIRLVQSGTGAPNLPTGAVGGPPGAPTHGKMSRLMMLNDSEKEVYERIKESGNKGISSKDLKVGLNPTLAEKAVKKLRAHDLIKLVKTLQSRSRKVFMLSELDPSETLTGGTWYNEDREFDKALVIALYKAVHQFVTDSRTMVSLDTIATAVNKSEIAKKLSNEDIQSIVQILCFDGKLIEVCNETSGKKFYQGAIQLIDPSHVETPCSQCPVQKECDSSGGGPINPQTCPYLKLWFDQQYAVTQSHRQQI
eukprot:TRINITY_DN5807_c0_g1_i1.p1 TRINITY_DN5807_c0_g1~~TRINITY_DN5807_c0_g1_i1.p1  ORF type:complete len:319 (+),score=32.49 TRINITY_DN5807_c0_g1_i1:401-1357(+)